MTSGTIVVKRTVVVNPKVIDVTQDGCIGGSDRWPGGRCGNFDIGFDHFSRIDQSIVQTPYTHLLPCPT